MFGLNIRDVRRLAFHIADKFYKTTTLAGKNWCYSFLKKNPEL